jgi:hypothetical protein
VVCEEIVGEVNTLRGILSVHIDLIDKKRFVSSAAESNTKFVLNVFIQMANSLAFIEDQGILHGGITPYVSYYIT